VASQRPKGKIPVVGVTGSIGSGKSTVARFFGTWGGAVISGDQVGHEVVDRSRSLRARLAKTFGNDILVSGRVNRRLLAERAFASPAKVRVLNKLVHPQLIRELNRQVRATRKRTGVRAVVIDAALLVEWGLGKIHWDILVGVENPPVLERSVAVGRKALLLRFHCQKRHHIDHIATAHATLLGQSVIIQPSVMIGHALAPSWDADYDETKSV
jgi:dephospho-CoA kinase